MGASRGECCTSARAYIRAEREGRRTLWILNKLVNLRRTGYVESRQYSFQLSIRQVIVRENNVGPRPHYTRNLKMEVLLWKRIKCFPSTLRLRNLKTQVSLWEGIECSTFTLRRKNLKTNNHRSYWICVWGNSFREITWLSWSNGFRKAPFFQKLKFFFHTKTKSRRLKIPPVWRAFSKSYVFVTD